MSDCNNSQLPTSPGGKGRDIDSMGTILSQSDFLPHDQGQMLGPELNLTEMSEGEYTHLQHLIQTHMETQAEVSDIPADQTKGTVMSPLSTTQAIDLSTSSDGHEVILPEEKTPLCYGEVPSFVLAKIRGENTAPSNTCSLPSKSRGPSTARVCLEKRFNSISGTLGHQDNQSGVLSNFLTVVQQPSETQDASVHPHLQSWIRCDRRNELSGQFIGIYNPVTSAFGQVICHLEPNRHQGLVIPKRLPLNLCPERVLAKTATSTNSTSGDKETPPPKTKSVQLCAKPRASKDTSDSPGKTGGKKRTHRAVPPSQRRERHNSMERERRRRIRLCCDELNMLVPFCQTDTDKVTTLQWTAAYLRYINKMYGDALREEFQKIVSDKDGLKPDPSSVNDLIVSDTQNIPMAVEP